MTAGAPGRVRPSPRRSHGSFGRCEGDRRRRDWRPPPSRQQRTLQFKRPACAAGLAAAALVTSAPALADPFVLLQDSFDTENGGVGAAEYSGFDHFSAANIDLLAPGYFFNLCQAAGGSTPCLDMEGSGNGSLTTKLAYDLAPGKRGGAGHPGAH